MKRRVVITGMGAVSPIGNNVNELWNSIENNKCGIDKISKFDTTDYKVKLAGEVKDLNAEEFLDAKEVKNNDKFVVYAKIACKEAMNNANINIDEIDSDRFGVVFASGIGGLQTIFENSQTLIERGNSRISPYFIPKTLINLAAGALAIEYKAKGYVTSVVTACAAGTNAIGDAYNRIKDGYEDIVLTGGAEAAVCEIGIAGFQAMRALCTADDPARASIPFDIDRKGFVMGEGAGVLVLEELEHAKKRNANIICEVVGYGASCDAFHITAPSETGEGGAIAMMKALKDANLEPNAIDYINAHGTSTHLNDLTETKAIKLAFKDHANKVMVSSTKSNTGHLLGASGAIEAIICAKAIQNSLVPATINYQNPDPECDLDIVPNKNRKANLKYVMSNSLGFGGHNASIILKKWED